ncbi:DNA polymerase-3 subunit delta' [Chitinivorax tropicus]|uniref:DNA polymerase III subunit delta' n=1 Tax=Chitinivorax tropicus TaxID=714531 RepID=A0A840MQG7_9PROT|nr:DNA polymerase III subunit delta' [Chitinivorax tropicus]MBB5018696.1 DNA polymerase-3 subunit delta' [Chitinivorax tropicus]
MSIHPWHAGAWAQLNTTRSRWPHALLLTGPQGIGKVAFAKQVVASLLCEHQQPDHQPCGQCDACHWLANHSHPDFRELTLLEDEDGDDETKSKKAPTQISIKQVRELTDFVNVTSHRQGSRITLLHPAEAMNGAAANALLKTLEEPPPGALFILVSHQPQRLLPTIRSRCRVFTLAAPSTDEATRWLAAQGVEAPEQALAQAGYAPLLALSLADPALQAERRSFTAALAEPQRLDPLHLADIWQKTDILKIVDWLQKWHYDLLSCQLSGIIRYHPERKTEIERLARPADPLRLNEFGKQLMDARRLAHHPLNPRLVLEQLFFAYIDTLKKQTNHG